jgi:hypothetical protein
MKRTTAGRPRLPIIVKVAEIGGSVHEVCLNGERKVEDALTAAGFSTELGNVKVNGEGAEEGMELEKGDIVTISKKTSYGM